MFITYLLSSRIFQFIKHILIHLILSLCGIQMEKKFKFTNERIKALPANPPNAKGTDLEVSDTEVIGLKCFSGKSGNKRWLLRYSTNSGRKTSIAIGRFPDIDVTLARKIARKHLQQIAEGHDPKAERDEIKKVPTVSQPR